jgi:predicted transposase YdaD
MITAERRGKLEGRAEERVIIARKMISAGIPVESASQLTGLSIAELMSTT